MVGESISWQQFRKSRTAQPTNRNTLLHQKPNQAPVFAFKAAMNKCTMASAAAPIPAVATSNHFRAK
jgi:hypothetical protein